ncbi:MAG: MbnP family protein [Thiotrichaceae bacterium]
MVATLPTGKNSSDFKGLCFTLGLPFTENHTDHKHIASPINVTGMLWSWTTGRKFIRVDGVGDPDGLKTSFHVHLGSSCSDVNKQGKQPNCSVHLCNARNLFK